MRIGAGGGSLVPQLQTSWTRAEAACAARHKGDAYYELTAPQPASVTTPTSDRTSAPTSDQASSTATTSSTQSEGSSADGLAPGFTLHL